ncbi:MAG: hypothetical protein LBK03_07105, partial [Bacteroidales bacterium]|nr:hypothetical protein [Bacteroidales bacterium]
MEIHAHNFYLFGFNTKKFDGAKILKFFESQLFLFFKKPYLCLSAAPLLPVENSALCGKLSDKIAKNMSAALQRPSLKWSILRLL